MLPGNLVCLQPWFCFAELRGAARRPICCLPGRDPKRWFQLSGLQSPMEA